jgi:hypothetical protein
VFRLRSWDVKRSESSRIGFIVKQWFAAVKLLVTFGPLKSNPLRVSPCTVNRISAYVHLPFAADDRIEKGNEKFETQFSAAAG